MRILLASFALAAFAQPKPADPKVAPKVIVASPLGVEPGKTAKLTLRGLRLDNATEVRLPGTKATAKIVRKGKVAVPNMQKPEHAGDSEIQIEIAVPKEHADESISLEVVSPTGTSAPHRILTARNVNAEKEPNNGFRESQEMKLPALVDGIFANPQDVDVFRIEGKAGQKIVAEVLAARHGSALDGILTLTDARGSILASSDDAVGTDPKFEFTLPRDGPYYLSLIDAHDQGGPAHVYRLVVK